MQHANYLLEPLVDAKNGHAKKRKMSQRYVSEHLFWGGSVGIRRHSDEMLREPKFTLNVSTLSLLQLGKENSNLRRRGNRKRPRTLEIHLVAKHAD